MKTTLTIDNTLCRIETMLDTLASCTTNEERAEVRRNAETSAKLLKLVVQEHANIVRADDLLGTRKETETLMNYEAD